MLHHCNNYPNPENGYPGYWWFKYGIRDVGSDFKSLETRRFIVLNESTGKYALRNHGKWRVLGAARYDENVKAVSAVYNQPVEIEDNGCFCELEEEEL